MTKPSLVIFDCDGVLVDSEPIAGAMFSEFVRAEGYSGSHEECLRTFRGRSMVSAVEIIEADIGRALPAEWPERVEQAVMAVFLDALDPIEHIHHVTEAVERAGLSSCVASSSKMPHIVNSVTKIGLADHFGENLFSASMVDRGKPAPDLFLHAGHAMGHVPEFSIVIEDSLPGVQAGVAAGMKVFGYAGDVQTDWQALANAGAIVFDDMRQLPALMGI
jgi:HAD superfamily hydrolase (TIGR01509 family)